MKSCCHGTVSHIEHGERTRKGDMFLPFLQVFHGQNVYGILRAPRASSTEAVVLSAPYRPPAADRDRTTGGVALMLALAKEFRSKSRCFVLDGSYIASLYNPVQAALIQSP